MQVAIFIGRRCIVMDYSCAKLVILASAIPLDLWFYRADRQTDRQNHMQMIAILMRLPSV